MILFPCCAKPDFAKTIRVRPSQGFEATDFFIGGLWYITNTKAYIKTQIQINKCMSATFFHFVLCRVWAPIIEALSEIGYDINNMFMASYDWRLSFSDLEVRISVATHTQTAQ